MKRTVLLLLLASVIFLISTVSGFSSENAPPADSPDKAPEGRDAPWHPEAAPGKTEPPVIKKLADGIFEVGGVTVNKPDGFVSVNGAVNMDDGLVEYLACGPMGKLHESVLVVHAQPYNLQVALLLLGLEPGNEPLERQGGPGMPQGDPVEIWVTWHSADRKEVKKRAEELIYNIKEKNTMPRTHWIYTGSEIVDGQFIAQVEQSIIATYHDPYAMFDHPLATGMDDTLYYANKQAVPPRGTPVTIVIKPAAAQIIRTP